MESGISIGPAAVPATNTPSMVVLAGFVKTLTCLMKLNSSSSRGAFLKAFKGSPLELDEFNFIKQVDVLTSPSKTTIEGVFVAGTAAGPMDIPDSILSAGCAASEVAAYLNVK